MHTEVQQSMGFLHFQQTKTLTVGLGDLNFLLGKLYGSPNEFSARNPRFRQDLAACSGSDSMQDPVNPYLCGCGVEPRL